MIKDLVCDTKCDRSFSCEIRTMHILTSILLLPILRQNDAFLILINTR